MTGKMTTLVERMTTAAADAMQRLKALLDAKISAIESDLSALRGMMQESDSRKDAALALVASRLDQIDNVITSIPSAADLATRAAGMVPVPVAQDISKFVDEARVRELAAEAAAEAIRSAPPAFNQDEFETRLLLNVPTVDDVAMRIARVLPVPKDGESFTLEQARPIVLELVRESMPTAEAVAEIVSRLYVNAWALDFERRAQDVLQRAIDRMPAPKDGKDGEDGMGFEHCSLSYDGERTLTLRAELGERSLEQAVKMAIPLYRKVFSDDAVYERGDMVTWGGSTWIALKDAPQGRPGDASRDWQLMVKKGRDASV